MKFSFLHTVINFLKSQVNKKKYSFKLDLNPLLDPVGDLRSLQGPAFYAINRNAYCNPSYATPLYTYLPYCNLQQFKPKLYSSTWVFF